MLINDDGETKSLNQQQPTLEQQYVVLPGHPFFGRQFIVLARRSSRTYTRCVIEDPEHPGFHYHINDRWLSPDPPAAAAQLRCTVQLPMTVLDRMAQLVLAKVETGRAAHDDTHARAGTPHLEPNSTTATGATRQAALRARLHSRRRAS